MKAAEKTKKRLINSMLLLMEEKPFDKVTIEEITEKAFLTRATFYNYFLDKHDLINTYYRQILETTIFQIGVSCSWEEATTNRFRELKNKHKFFSHAFQVEDANSIFSEEYQASISIYTNLAERMSNNIIDDELAFLIKFYCLGSMKTTTQWIDRDMAESPETMTQYLKEAMPQRLRQLLNLI